MRWLGVVYNMQCMGQHLEIAYGLDEIGYGTATTTDVVEREKNGMVNGEQITFCLRAKSMH